MILATRFRSVGVWAAVLTAAVLTGCGGGEENDGEEISKIAGDVRIDGSSTVFPIAEAVKEEFSKKYPKVNVTVGRSGTGGGFKAFINGETDISDASRPIKAEELAKVKEAKIEFIELPVAYDGLTIVVSKENTWCDELTVEQLQEIFLSESPAATWKDVDESWPAEKIEIFAPGEDSGTYDYFKEVVAGKTGTFREDISKNEDDNVLVTGVSGVKGGIGYFGASYYFNNTDTLKAVKIVNPETQTAVAPTPETIESGEYAPFSRPLFIYIKKSSAENPQVDLFVKFFLKNAGEMAKKVDYVALPADLYALATKHYTEGLTGTHYLDEEGEKRTGALKEVYTEANLPKE